MRVEEERKGGMKITGRLSHQEEVHRQEEVSASFGGRESR